MKKYSLLLVLLLLSGCQSTGPVKSFTSSKDVETLSDEENRLWHQARQFDTALVKNGSLYENDEVNNYLQSVMDKLFPEFDGKIKIQVIKSPTLNAFALPNGSIYFHLGLLARLENEDQLATVIAHEGGHFTNKHSVLGRRNIMDSAALATSLAVMGIPVVGDLLAYSSIYGYSRDLERDADSVAYQRLKKAGYDVREAPKTFQHLAVELKLLEVEEPYFFSSHPKLLERIESFSALIKNESQITAKKPENKFLELTKQARVDCLEADLAMSRDKSVIYVLEQKKKLRLYPDYAEYYLGEAYRKRGKDGDITLARKAYKNAISKAPSFANSYYSLGVSYMKDMDNKLAKGNFAKYLKLEPKGKHAQYAQHYLKELN